MKPSEPQRTEHDDRSDVPDDRLRQLLIDQAIANDTPCTVDGPSGEGGDTAEQPAARGRRTRPTVSTGSGEGTT